MRMFLMVTVSVFVGSLLTQSLFGICINQINTSASTPSEYVSTFDASLDALLWVGAFRFDISAMVQILSYFYMLTGLGTCLWTLLSKKHVRSL